MNVNKSNIHMMTGITVPVKERRVTAGPVVLWAGIGALLLGFGGWVLIRWIIGGGAASGARREHVAGPHDVHEPAAHRFAEVRPGQFRRLIRDVSGCVR
jgi:hypothetical protein